MNHQTSTLEAQIPDACPRCSCPFWEQQGERTCDGHHAWKDTDGRWYNGPARESIRRSCSFCGWTQRIERRRGKLESVQSDPLGAVVLP